MSIGSRIISASILPPKYPFPIDQTKAAAGKSASTRHVPLATPVNERELGFLLLKSELIENGSIPGVRKQPLRPTDKDAFVEYLKTL